jgi:hypothetical protein
LVFSNADRQWVLLEVADWESTPITISGGQTFIKPEWSRDSRYLSFNRPQWLIPDDEEDVSSQIFILTIP